MACTTPALTPLLPAYLSGDLTGAEMEAFGDHLDECHECSERFLRLAAVEDGLRQAGRSVLPGVSPT